MLENLVGKQLNAKTTKVAFKEAVQDFEKKIADTIDDMEAVNNSYGGISLNSTADTFTLEEYKTYYAKLQAAETGLEGGVSGETLWDVVKEGFPMADDDTETALTKAYNDYSVAKEEFCKSLTSLKAVVEAAEAASAEGLYDDPKIVKDDSMNAEQKVTYNCIWFGRYPQVEIVDEPLNSGVFRYWEKHDSYKVNKRIYKLLQKATGWDENGEITLEGVRYRRIKRSDTHTDNNDTFDWGFYPEKYHYFRYMPIKWRILDHTVQAPHDKVLLSADKLLDYQQFNQSLTSVTWETSTIRSWLNGLGASGNACGVDYTGSSFIGSAFTDEERNCIPVSQLELDNTQDKVFLLSYDDLSGSEYGGHPSYGFNSEGGARFDEASYRLVSSYARAMGVFCMNASDPGNWVLRTFGNSSVQPSFVLSSGYLDYSESYVYVDSCFGICPAVCFTGLESTVYKPAGTVCTDGTVKEKNGEIVQETQSWTLTAKTRTVKYAKVRKKAQTVKPLSVNTEAGKMIGTVSYTIAGGSKAAKKALSVNKKNGKITVKKKTKKGTYKIKVKVTAAGNKYYEKESATRTLTVKVK